MFTFRFLPLFLLFRGTQLLSPDCSTQLNLYLNALRNKEQWALQMFDAGTKLPPGLLAGNYYDLGNFDECLGVSNGKYCLGTVPVDPNSLKLGVTRGGQIRMLGNQPEFSGLHFATCVPNKCSADDVSQMYFGQKFDEKYCYSKEAEPAWTWGALTTIGILAAFGLLVVGSTAYDVCLFYIKRKPVHDLLVAFSYLTNGRKLLTSTSNSDQLLCLNGIKVLSMMWIVLGHEYVNGSSGAVANYSKLAQIIQEPANMFIMGATVAVDTFFVVGGAVLVYTFLKTTEKGTKFNLIWYYIHRYIRLTPALAVVVLVHATLLKHLGNGPLWNSFDDHLVQPCRKHWWAALLYIQNYIHDEQACVPQSWYLSIDMQLFILSPLVLLPLAKNPKWALAGLGILTVAGIAVPFVIAFQQELNAFMVGDKETTQKYIFGYYEQTYGRFGAYVIGMLLGYAIYGIKKRGKFHLNWYVSLLLWIVCLAVAVSCVYAGHDTMVSGYNQWSHSLYIAFNRPSWSIAISGIIFLCVSGNGGPVNVFLSASIFQFLSKISYAIYLVHYELILLRAYSYKAEIIIEHFYVFFNFWGDFVFSVGISIILCLTFESPVIVIEKALLQRGTRGARNV